MSRRSFPQGVFESEASELLIDLGIKVVEKHLRPEFIELLHLLGSLACFGSLPLLKSRLADLGVRLSVSLFLSGGRCLFINPNDSPFGLARFSTGRAGSRLSADAIDKLELLKPAQWKEASRGLRGYSLG